VRSGRRGCSELRRFGRGEAFDEQPMPDLDSEALDFRAASESFAPVRKIVRRDLETLHLVTDHQGRKVPTVGGVLLFGRDRRGEEGRRVLHAALRGQAAGRDA
jgi:predicted HTH transcriptional regulator